MVNGKLAKRLAAVEMHITNRWMEYISQRWEPASSPHPTAAYLFLHSFKPSFRSSPVG